MLGMIGPEPQHILDVGCSTGLLAASLAERGHSVVGIELDSDRARLAERFCQRVVEADVSSPYVFEQLEESFDAIIYGDVLEHLPEPQDVLRRCRTCLKPRGAVIASIPNVANYRVRAGLLAGRFRYEEEGLLDRTHLRFFTLATAVDMVTSAGLEVVDRRFAAYRLPKLVVDAFPGLLAVQLVLRALSKHPDAISA
jgi:2-polyprenyl-3-methyl-5-hydroxy-6-metoxy-1,4-benzoquinol methylase